MVYSAGHGCMWIFGCAGLYSVDRNVLFLDVEGKRVVIKYCSYDWFNLPAKLALEKLC